MDTTDGFKPPTIWLKDKLPLPINRPMASRLSQLCSSIFSSNPGAGESRPFIVVSWNDTLLKRRLQWSRYCNHRDCKSASGCLFSPDWSFRLFVVKLNKHTHTQIPTMWCGGVIFLWFYLKLDFVWQCTAVICFSFICGIRAEKPWFPGWWTDLLYLARKITSYFPSSPNPCSAHVSGRLLPPAFLPRVNSQWLSWS